MDSIPGSVHPVPDADGQTNTQSTTGLRRLLPAVNAASSADQPSASSGLTRQTRHQVVAACLQCRKRKVKCSGNRPTCHRCLQTEIECKWDTEPDTPRIVQIRRRKEELERENENLHELLRFLHSRPEEEAVEILKRLRASGDALQVLDFVRTADLLLQRRRPQPARGASPRDPDPEVDDVPAGFLRVPARPWTVLANDGVVFELITGFFSWDASFFLAFVDQKAFLEDMRDCLPETARYCSPVLVNAICALRCHTSRRAKAFGHVNGCDMRAMFFEEAKRLLDAECGSPSLTTAQALFIMHLSAAATGMDRAARMYQLAAFDMVERIQKPEDPVTDGRKDREHDRVMSRALWGLYCFESIFAFAYLRPSLIPIPPIPRSFIDQIPRDSRDSSQDDYPAALLPNATCDLSRISNKAMEYNAGLRLDDIAGEKDILRRISLFAELRAWRNTMPHEFKEAEAFSPSAYYLRAYEDQTVLAIFRPLPPDLQLPDNGCVDDLLLAYCERSVAGIEEHERALSLRECSSMVLTTLFNASVTLVRLLRKPKTHELFARTCRLIRDRADDFPFAGYLLRGLQAMAADGGDQIPAVAKPHFEGLQLDEGTLKDVPISFVLPSRRDGRGGTGGQGDAGVQLGALISSWNRLSMS